jgi:GNAT superfamily N-acetyltransferase
VVASVHEVMESRPCQGIMMDMSPRDHVGDVEVRAALDGDLGDLLRLLRQLHPDYPGFPEVGPERIREIAGQAGRVLLVATMAGRVVGTADLLIIPNLSHGGLPHALVENVVVDEDVRSHGVGAALFEEIFERTEEARCYKVELVSLKHRRRAHAFYERLGFEAVAHGFRRYAEGHGPTRHGD